MKTTTYLLAFALGAGFILSGCASDTPTTTTTSTSTTERGVTAPGLSNSSAAQTSTGAGLGGQPH